MRQLQLDAPLALEELGHLVRARVRVRARARARLRARARARARLRVRATWLGSGSGGQGQGSGCGSVLGIAFKKGWVTKGVDSYLPPQGHRGGVLVGCALVDDEVGLVGAHPREAAHLCRGDTGEM